jgi:hypothetical protein
MHPSSQYHKELAQLVRGDKDNKRCCDCGKNNPRWASTNLGCFMCLECSGIHRAIGVHITKIKSITLDKWTQSEVDFMKTVGNRIHNARWEAFLSEGQGIMPQSSMRDRDIFIRAKYNNRKFYSNIPKDQLPPPVKLDVGGSGTAPKFQTAAQRAKARREAAAREKKAREEAERVAALKAKEESEANARLKKANDDKLASRRRQMEARVSEKKKEKEAARLRRQQRKNQRVRRRSKELNSLYQQAANTNNKDDDTLVGEVVVTSSNSNDKNSVNNNNNTPSDDLLDLMSGDQFSTSPVTTPVASNTDDGVSGFSFLTNNNSNSNNTANVQQEPKAPQVDTMVSGFSFLSATAPNPSISANENIQEATSPMGMPSNNANAIDSAFADLTALAPTPPPSSIQENNNNRASNVTNGQQQQQQQQDTAAMANDNLLQSLNENDVVQLESTLGQVQQTVQWYSEALTAFTTAKNNLAIIEEKIQNANGSDGDLVQRINYLKEQVMATHAFIHGLPIMS